MKYILIFFVITFAGCASQSTAQLTVNSSNQTNLSPSNANTSANTQSSTDEKTKDQAVKSEKFKVAPEEFKDVDFGNFTYPFGSRNIRLKDKEFSISEKMGGESFSLGDVYYADLTGDAQKEAIVLFISVGCGGSCDGGRVTIYFYAAQKTKPSLLGKIQTGETAGGCALKALTIQNKQIIVEQFSKCTKDSAVADKYDPTLCKFCVKGSTHSVYKFDNARLRKISSEAADTSEQNIMNYQAEVSITE